VIRGGIVALAFGLASSTAAAGDEVASLRDGHVEITPVAVKDSGTPMMVVRALVASPPAKVWAVVSDCAHYAERMPRIVRSALLESHGNVFTCEVTLSTPFPMPNLTAVTEATHEVTAAGMTRTWKLVRGDYVFNEGSWDVRPVDGGGSSLVTYRVHAEPKVPVPGFLRDMAQRKALPELIARLRTEASRIP
jgi:ribosome-associated toxin RatA of RatAB toxin-antitoxin module